MLRVLAEAERCLLRLSRPGETSNILNIKADTLVQKIQKVQKILKVKKVSQVFKAI
jgi:DNA-binding CsgD family transcriptional regulator